MENTIYSSSILSIFKQIENPCSDPIISTKVNNGE